jgi:lipoprotein-releasing system permease protein
LSIEKFIADKITGSDKDKSNISKPIVKIGIIGIVLGVVVMLLTLSIVVGFKKEITNKITGLTMDIAISNVNINPSNEPDPIRISKDTIEMLKKIPFVKHIQTTAFKNGILKTNTENEGVLLKGINNNYDFSFLTSHLLEGRLPKFNDSIASKDILISKALAERLDLKVNGKMLIYFITQHETYDSTVKESIIKSEQRSRNFTICGIFKTDFSDFDNNLTFVDLKQIQKLNYWEDGMVGNYEIKINNFDNLIPCKEEIQNLMSYYYNVSSVKDIYSNIFVWLDKLDINGVIIIVLMILVAVINMITALLILILERTNMVGLVKALGMTNPNVRKIFLYISLKLVGKGLLWGNIIGIGLCYLQYYFKIAKLDSATYYVDYVAIDINWIYILLLNSGTFITCLLMLFLPTLIITKLTPIKTLRFD